MLVMIAVFIGIIGLGCLSAGFLTEGQKLTYIRCGIIVIDILIFAVIFFSFMMRGRFVSVAEAAVMLIMAQVIGSILVLLAGGIQWLYQMLISAPVDAGRRSLLKGAAIYPAVAVGVGMYGGLVERTHTVDRRMDVPMPVGSGLDGYRMAQISDVHLGSYFSVEDFHDLLERVAKGTPDVLCVTGDIFDDEGQNRAAIEVLGTFTSRFPDGIYYCRGNHEYFRGIEAISRELQKTDVVELVNAAVCLKNGERPLYMVGVDYPMRRNRFEADEAAYTEEAYRGVPEGAISVLLAHHPDFIDDGALHGASLVLSGHTHGCQLGLFGLPLVPVFKYNRGVVDKGATMGYVHSGNGSWFPYRLGCPPEIAWFTLRERA
ncbi:metallophosphoesterase [Selenomonas sp. TAMA-11512]|uniref:metallophosphoesterase n=1 Tax=Selenomonas sp. TAMA-11512 TaxID=3095337 RepID=UPI0030D44D54